MVQFEIHRTSQAVQPVGNCGHVKETHQSRQSTAASRSTREEGVSSSRAESERERLPGGLQPSLHTQTLTMPKRNLTRQVSLVRRRSIVYPLFSAGFSPF